MRDWGMFLANMALNQARTGYYLTDGARVQFKPKQDSYDPVTNVPGTVGRVIDYINMNQAAGLHASPVFQLTLDGGHTMTPTNGDVVYACSKYQDLSPVPQTAELTLGTPYYVVNSSGGPSTKAGDTVTFDVARTSGGTAIVFTDNPWPGYNSFSCTPQIAKTYAVSSYPPYLIGSDSYAEIARAAMVMAYMAGHPDILAADVDGFNAFSANVDRSQWATWDMAVPAGLVPVRLAATRTPPVAATAASVPSPAPTAAMRSGEPAHRRRGGRSPRPRRAGRCQRAPRSCSASPRPAQQGQQRARQATQAPDACVRR